ncbi:MAG: nucleotidyltransferase domain-containing protein [Euryarchaeota archaeon]|nr:nucleotidyltransferase domain-containing protein [Euryarchaeota archaeon]
MSEIQGTKRQIVGFFLGRQTSEPATLKEIARHMRLAPPSALAQLRAMVKLGIVAEDPAPKGRGRTYRLARYMSATWVDPERNVMISWTSGAPVSWKYPLVSRVPDYDAQETLLRFLESAEMHGHFHASSVRAPSVRNVGEDLGVTMIAYGSCARGDARPGSDLDLLILAPSLGDPKEKFKDLAADVNLSAARKLDLKVIAADEFRELPVELQKAVRREGLIVYSSREDAWFVEARRGEE